MKLRAKRDFVRTHQKGDSELVKQGKEFTPSPTEVSAAVAQGFKTSDVHSQQEVPMSALFNHCEPVDDEAQAAFKKFFAGRGKS